MAVETVAVIFAAIERISTSLQERRERCIRG
jgi:hypothetical protein